MAKYAKGSKAWGVSDRSGLRYKLKDLVWEYRNGKRTGLRVGRDEFDGNHPQDDLGKRRINDPQSLYDPRPDTHTESLWGWNPVGNPATYITPEVGKVTTT